MPIVSRDILTKPLEASHFHPTLAGSQPPPLEDVGGLLRFISNQFELIIYAHKPVYGRGEYVRIGPAEHANWLVEAKVVSTYIFVWCAVKCADG